MAHELVRIETVDTVLAAHLLKLHNHIEHVLVVRKLLYYFTLELSIVDRSSRMFMLILDGSVGICSATVMLHSQGFQYGFGLNNFLL